MLYSTGLGLSTATYIMYPAIPLPIKVNIEIKILDFTVTKNARKQASGLAMFANVADKW